MDRYFLFWLICIVCIVLILDITCMVAPFLNSCYYILAKNVFCLIVGHWFFLFARSNIFQKRINPNKKAVFITGCDSGFGFQLAKLLDSKGYHVFAGCLFPISGGGAELKSSCSSRFCTVHIDVTQDDSVQNAKAFVEKNIGDCELWAVVNNAGVFKGMSVEFSPMSDFVDSLQVNTLGPVRVTKAFLPLLRQSKGRIVNVNSISGRVAFPFMSCYAMSKFGSVAFTECLRREIDTFGVKVISIEPELFKTPMSDSENVKKQLEPTRARMEESLKSSSGKKYVKQVIRFFSCLSKIASPNVHHVINAMEAAVSMQHPCPVYHPGGNTIRQILFYCTSCLPDHLFDAFYRIFNATEPVLGSLCSTLM